MDKRAPGSVNQSVTFHMSQVVAITGLKLGYIRYNRGDGSSYTQTLSGALTELAAITTAHTDNAAKYLSTDATGGNQFVLRVDFPDAAFASGVEEVICNVYDDENNVIAQRVFRLAVELEGYVEGYVYLDSNAPANTNTVLGWDGTAIKPVTTVAAAKTLADQIGKKIRAKGSFVASGINLDDYTIEGDGNNDMLCASNTSLVGARISKMSVRGEFITSSTTIIEKCKIYNVTGSGDTNGIGGQLFDCNFSGNIKVADVDTVHILNGRPLDSAIPTFDLTSVGITSETLPGFMLTNFKGECNLINLTNNIETPYIQVNSNGDTIIHTDNTNTVGNLILNGIGKWIDSSSAFDSVDRTNWKDIYNKQLESYVNGFVYFNSAASNTETKLGIDGTLDNPVSSEAAAKALADIVGKRIWVEGTFPATLDYSAGFEFGGDSGANVISASGACNLSNCTFKTVGVTGQFETATDTTRYFNCR
ncbi:MAG: hypothetical protein R3209_06315, partial [Salinimicrobium sediminis]|nr:hypothetical protein [Salinimicrobium sediminis]